MTGPEATTTNYAADSSHVGVQAGTVHNVNVYSAGENASPADKFQAGVRQLDGSMPTKARQLIHEAIVDGHSGNQVCFYWLLALVSGRTRHEMSSEDTAALRHAPSTCHLTGSDAWADGVRTICALLDSARQPDADLRPLLKDFDGLGDTQRALILRHMELYLSGPLQNQMWHRALQSAKQDQMAGNRSERVWRFFEPEPARPRVREPRPPDTPTGTWLKAVTATAVLAAAAADIGYMLAREDQVFALLAYLLAIAGGSCAARGGLEWRHRVERRRTKDEEYAPPSKRPVGAPSGGFADKVDRRFDHYFAKYVPHGTNRSTWLAMTAGIRKSIRDEVVEVYRESRTGVEKISWLIRYRVSEITRQWENDTLWSYRQELTTPLVTKAGTLLGLAALLVGAARTVGTMTRIAPLNASPIFALVAGGIAAHAWSRILLERRRYEAGKAESERTLRACEAAYMRWQEKLADKPEDPEMARWLDNDRKALLGEALCHYKLAMNDLLSHAFIEAPASSSTRRARVLNGPWRYKRYQLLLFLLTRDGVRQYNAELDIEQGSFHDRHRTNYRYDAVAAVRVRQADNNERKFELALVNGELISVEVMASDMEELQLEETPGVVSEVTLDAAGLHHTLHVMEGIAAEGRQWITQERRRTSDR